MATYYVTKLGNDTTGVGTLANPWLTIDKAFRQNASLAAGDTILIGDGTYVETDGSGRLLISKSFASFVTIAPVNGSSGNVIIKGTSGSYTCLVANAAFVKFQYLTFQSIDATTIGIIRFTPAAALNNIYWDHCTFTVTSSGSQTNFCFTSAVGAGSSVIISNITVDSCTFGYTGTATDATRGFFFAVTDALNVVSNITISNNTFNVTQTPITVQGCTNFLCFNNICNGLTAVTGGYGIITGYDSFAFTGTGTCSIYNNYVNSAGGHVVLVGSGITSGNVHGNIMFGGNSLSAGQGLVLKNCNAVTVYDNIILDGYNSGLYFKASTNCIAERNIIYRRFSDAITAGCVRLGTNVENNSKASGNTIRYNKMISTAARMFYWDGTSGDGLNNVCNYNDYILLNSTTWGTIRGNVVAGSSISTLQANWVGYTPSGNDANSGILGTLANLTERGLGTGNIYYAVVTNSSGNAWNGSSYVAPTTSNWYSFVRPFYEQVTSSEQYFSLFPSYIGSGTYSVTIYNRTGFYYQLTDPVVDRGTLIVSGTTNSTFEPFLPKTDWDENTTLTASVGAYDTTDLYDTSDFYDFDPQYLQPTTTNWTSADQ